MNSEFKPKRSIAERYSIESSAKDKGMTVEEFQLDIDERIKLKNMLFQTYLTKGYTEKQAEVMVMRLLYIPGFGGRTFYN
jgi:hypothetical protein